MPRIKTHPATLTTGLADSLGDGGGRGRGGKIEYEVRCDGCAASALAPCARDVHSVDFIVFSQDLILFGAMDV